MATERRPKIVWRNGGEYGTTPEGFAYEVQREHLLSEPPWYDVTVVLPDGSRHAVGDSLNGRGAAVKARGLAQRDYEARLAAAGDGSGGGRET